ncbi:matrixin family metalloprotease [Lactobacillus sp. ESL0680]|uniref:matrixin family metalloprotease n=1 Tax=Lactobacillus sp. ESL0680 TaxID=2983210 RepID=UPI0023F673CF|nr:matrixin family metalloprotease [Lactobacillus sp. ESL0680]WEV38790.1 matrixin family metalloprotease [Lactobacillus sp. ESL0680]
MHENKIIIFIELLALMGTSTSTVFAKTKSVTPAQKCRFPEATSTYVIDKQSKYYKSVWKKAVSGWNKVGFDWKKSSDSKIHLMALTIKQDKRRVKNPADRLNKKIAGICLTWRYEGTNIIAKEDVKLNKDALSSNHYTKKQAINVAEHELGHALGLNHNLPGSKSVMNPANRIYPISKPDIRGMKKIYSTSVNDDLLSGTKKPKLVLTVLRIKVNSLK